MTIENSQSPPPRVEALTGLRFIAAFSIAFGHTVPWSVSFWSLPPRALTAIGMPLFFTLSGFIIHYSHSKAFASSPWRTAAPDFAVARFSRIYPLYLALLLYALVQTPMGARLASPDAYPFFGVYLLGIFTWFPFSIDGKPLAEWYYGIAWSVSTELFFYICYALFLYRVAGIARLRAAVAGIAVFVILAFAAIYVVFVTSGAWEAWAIGIDPGIVPRTKDFKNSLFRWALYHSPYSQILGFICGVLTCQLCLLVQRRDLAARVPANILAWGSVLGIALLWWQLVRIGMTTPWQQTTNLASFFVNSHMNMAMVPFCCALIFALAIGKTSLGALLSLPAVVFLGEISYSTYLSHPIAQQISGWIFGGTPLVVNICLTLVVITALAALFYFLIEVPAKRFLRRKWAERRSSKAHDRGRLASADVQ